MYKSIITTQAVTISGYGLVPKGTGLQVNATTAASLVSGGQAEYINTPSYPAIPSTPSNDKSSTINIISSINSSISDDGNFLVNATSSNYTYTLAYGMGSNFGVALIQQSTGTITIAAGSGVTFVGATLATTSAGDIISVIWLAAETYLIKVG